MIIISWLYNRVSAFRRFRTFVANKKEIRLSSDPIDRWQGFAPCIAALRGGVISPDSALYSPYVLSVYLFRHNGHLERLFPKCYVDICLANSRKHLRDHNKLQCRDGCAPVFDAGTPDSSLMAYQHVHRLFIDVVGVRLVALNQNPASRPDLHTLPVGQA